MTRITITMQPETPPAGSESEPDHLSAATAGSPSPIPESLWRGGGPGSGPLPCEDPAAALGLLNAELGRLRESKADAALFRAHARGPQFFDDAVKRTFLHAENYVVKAAADRMLSYWEARADLFGDDRMLLPMDKSGTLKDEDTLALDQGLVQILPQKDLDGHTLLWYDPSRLNTKLGITSESMLRVIWYMLHVAMEDPVTRENGFVLLVHPKRCTPEQIDRNVIAKGAAIIGSIIPLRWRGFHICHPCSSYNKYFPLVRMLSPREMKDNIAVHFGTEEHVLECMAGYSLPADRLPADVGGGEQLDYAKWLSDRKEREGADALRVTTPIPRPPSAQSTGTTSDASMADAPKSPKKPATAKAVAKPKGAAPTSRPKTKKNVRSSPSPVADVAQSSGGSSTGGAAATGKARRPGRKGDARMHRAVTIKIENPETSLVEALQEGGFVFEGLSEKGKPHHEVFDQDGVSLMQRKNQLLRRIRVEKKKRESKTDEA